MQTPATSWKSIVLILIFIAGLVPGASAQDEEEMYENRTFYGGLVLGTNFAQIDGDNFAGYNKVGLNVGGLVYIKLDEHIATSLEILYSQKGSKSKSPQVLAPGYYITKYGVNLNYAEVPVMINYFDKRKSHFGAGLSYSQLASSNENIATNPAPVIAYDQTKYPFKKSDLNLLLSGSLHMYKGFFLNLRFQYSLITIRNSVPNVTRAEQFNNMWTLRVMYLFM